MVLMMMMMMVQNCSRRFEEFSGCGVIIIGRQLGRLLVGLDGNLSFGRSSHRHGGG